PSLVTPSLVTPVCAGLTTATDAPRSRASTATAAVTTVLPTPVPVPVTIRTLTDHPFRPPPPGGCSRPDHAAAARSAARPPLPLRPWPAGRSEPSPAGLAFPSSYSPPVVPTAAVRRPFWEGAG